MGNLLTSLLSTASALNVYEKALEVIQNNTTNATTPGYARQILLLEARRFQLDEGAPGGVAAGSLQSTRDQYAERNVQVQQQLLGASDAFVSQLSQLEPIFDLQSDTGVSGSLNHLFAAFSQLTVSPNDAVARQSVINAANAVARAFNTSANSLKAASIAADNEIRNSVSNINAIVADIQKINVAMRSNADAAADPGLDARLHVDLENLAQYADFTTIRQADGTVSIFLGGQKPLLIGASQFEIQADFSDPQTKILDVNGNDITSVIQQGKLAALLTVKNVDVPGYLSQLNQLAQSVADEINTQLAAGVDQTGNPGAPLFSYSATGSEARTLTVTSITASQIAAGNAANPGGNDNAIALSQLQNQTIAALGNFTFTQFYGNLSSVAGRDLANAKDSQSTQQQLLAQARSLRADASAVSLDEEAAKLMAYQKVYDATGRLISVINDMTQTLLGIIK